MANIELKDLTLRNTGNVPRHTRPLLLILLILAIAAVAVYAPRLRKTRPPKPAQPCADAAAQPAAPDTARILAGIRAAAERGDLIEARNQAYASLEQATHPEITGALETQLAELNFKLLFTPSEMPEKTEYIVQPGDSLIRIAKKFHTTVELIKKSNVLQRSVLHPGDRLRIFNATFAIAVSKQRNDLLLTANNRFFKRYRVGTGKYGTTPVGTFVIADKIEEPPWWRPDGKMVPFGDKENVLGTRWMSFEATGETPKVRGYGIHGTWEPETIGQQASAGCVRMHNHDVEELFTIIPLGTQVIITE